MKIFIYTILLITIISIMYPWHMIEVSHNTDYMIQFFLSNLYPYLLLCWIYIWHYSMYGHILSFSYDRGNVIYKLEVTFDIIGITIVIQSMPILVEKGKVKFISLYIRIHDRVYASNYRIIKSD